MNRFCQRDMHKPIEEAFQVLYKVEQAKLII
jgi:hypothetical protein